MWSFKPLFITMAEKEITNGQLRELISASSSTMAKLSKHPEAVSLRIVGRICEALESPVEKVIEYTQDTEKADA